LPRTLAGRIWNVEAKSMSRLMGQNCKKPHHYINAAGIKSG
jgi:hypothetical protein